MTDAVQVNQVRRAAPRRTGSWRGSGIKLYLPVVALTILIAAFVLPPAVMLIQTSLTDYTNPDGGYSLENFARLLEDPALYISAFNSVLFAAGATIVSLVVGASVAWVVERTNAPFKQLALATTVVSLGTPAILYVSAWVFLLGRAGPVNATWRALTGSKDTIVNVYSIPGMMLVEGLLWVPLVFLLCGATFKRQNADLEEAARMSGASVFNTVMRVSLPLAKPALLGLSIFIFIRNIEAFDVPVLLGTPGGVKLLTSDVYLAMTRVPPDLGHSSSFAVVLIVFVSVLLYFYGRISRNADRYASVTGKGFRPRPFDLGRYRWVGGMVILLNFLMVLALPLAAMLWNSVTPFVRAFEIRALSSLTLKNYAVILSDPYYLGLAFNTILASAAAATVVVAVTALGSWFAVRKFPGSQLIEQFASIPIIFPGIVLGVAMIQLALRTPFGLYGSIWLIVIAFIIRYMPYGMRYAQPGVMQIHRELEEAAGIAGATQRSIFRRVVLPLLSPALIAGWLFIFLLAAKELSIAVLLSSTSSKTIAVAMFNQWTNGQPGEVAALGILWTILMSLCATVMIVLTRKDSKSEGAL
ncbi:ABC-type transporter, integral membrane subunit [Rhizobium sp. CF080]|uniref:ABC transporter permease n=1 Tax=Rhizobium sp. (strain CF080) TaxID=1144310 RepID=UPI0002717883|nr:iron ABC transporter permease [Rhizobium sp. CF080]EUB98143.1 ABC-type transporter, integral membrane subunit [Rhizobium sp. CF080]